ncbi:MAG: hypothetical protein ACRCSK_06540, partial [Fusobacteriaceae bacterium]
MKKLYVAILLVMVSTFSFALDFYVLGGVSAAPTLDISYTNPKDSTASFDQDPKSMGWEAGVEIMQSLWLIELGAGVKYQTQSLDKTGAFTSIPLYGTLRYNILPLGVADLYTKLNAGYAFNNLSGEDMSKVNSAVDALTMANGFYGSIGLGVEVLSFIVEISYQMT